MAKVKPFRGIRPPREIVTEVASRPYDVLNSEEARTEAEGNPRSLYHIIKPEIDFAPGTDEHAPEVYDRAVAEEPFRTPCMESNQATYCLMLIASGQVSMTQ